MKKNQKGQASILFALMATTLILFFSFVIHTGLLVNAKINLQNAADLAAYAGASVQARQLNHISYLNYEMRRTLKKFLFKYYVVGNMAQQSHPQSGMTGKRRWSPDNNPNNDYQVPAVCLKANEGDNYCWAPTLPKIAAPSGFNDIINNAAKEVLAQLEKIRANSCKSIGTRNLQVLLLWLFNTDPELIRIEQLIRSKAGANGSNDDQAKQLADMLKIVKVAGQGLGLLPKEILLSMRIKTLASYVNESGKTNVNLSRLNQLLMGRDTAKRERTIQAYLSAYYTLGEHAFPDSESIIMDEILPPGSEPLLNLDEIQIAFDTYAINLGFKNPNGTNNDCQDDVAPDQDNPKDCIACPTPITVNAGVPVGVYKNQNTETYYAIKLSAPVSLLFSPVSGLTLSAYSAAKPYGSRIGPKLDAKNYTWEVSNPKFCDPFAPGTNAGLLFPCQKKIPNMPIRADDSDNPGSGVGFDNNEMIAMTYSSLMGNNPSAMQNVSAETFARGLFAAQYPSPWESGKYNIPVNDTATPSSSNVKRLEDIWAEHFDQNGVYAFWAPVISPEATGTTDLTAAMKEYLDELEQSGIQAGASARTFDPAFKESLVEGMTEYSELLRQGKGEDGEGFHIVRLRDPFNYPAETGNRTIVEHNNPNLALPIDPKLVKTSWNGVKHEAWQKLGRNGYSVKYVSFRQLASEGSAQSTLKSVLADDFNEIKH